MSACEKCWGLAYMRAMSDTSKTQTEHYTALLEERKDNPCAAPLPNCHPLPSRSVMRWRQQNEHARISGLDGAMVGYSA